MSDVARGMDKELTSYGDAGFSRFLRRAFIKGMGYTDSVLLVSRKERQMGNVG